MSKTMSEAEMKALIDKIGRETEAAGLPWIAGLFNQELIKAAIGEKEEGKPEADVPTADEIFRRDMEEARADQHRHNEAIRKADQEVFSAISSAVGGMQAIEKEINPEVLTPEELVNLGDTLAELGNAVAAMRQSMNPPWMSGAYGYGCSTAIV